MTVQVEDAHFSHACISSLECKWVLVCRCLECFCLFSGDINRIRKFMRWHGICCSYTWFICIYTILESHNPIFFGQTALTIFVCHYGFDRLEPLLWELLRLFYGLFSTKCRKSTVLQLLRVGLCESCYGFLRFFFNKFWKIRFCYG